MKYKAKVKSLKDLMSMADSVDARGALGFGDRRLSFAMQAYCGKEIEFIFDTNYKDYVHEDWHFDSAWLTDIRQIEENEVWKPEKDKEFYFRLFYFRDLDRWGILKEKRGYSLGEICFSTEEKALKCLEWLKKEGFI